MNPRTARGIAWSLVVLYIVLAAAGLTLQAVSNAPYLKTAFPVLALLVILVGGWIVTGALIISRHPQHPVGWLLCAGLFAPAIDMFAAGYAAYDTYLLSGSLPGVGLALVWLKLGNLGALGNVALTLIILFFPDGSLPSPRWRGVSRTAVGTLLLYLPLQALEPGPADPSYLPIRINPLGVSPPLWAFLKPLMWAAFSILALCYVAALLSLLFRLGRARGDERQQIKWLLLPAWLYGIFLLLYFIGLAEADEVITGIGLALAQFAVAGMIIAIAFAIFKYRLYDIDIIINKTLVYGALTATLALVYFMSVVLLQQVLPSESPISIVLSTLAIAALFSPLLRRIQNTIDRRFYRRKYDAQQTLAAFSQQMRDEVELEKLSETLLAVVDETMQPAHASLWLRESN
ncbi:MAG TPA: hypothetical protein VE136_12245 [Anaerolineales bacterium]|jgi:hypothetical protein|nr:hypothetical protein [Anaerolineales bacterium]